MEGADDPAVVPLTQGDPKVGPAATGTPEIGIQNTGRGGHVFKQGGEYV